MCHQDGLHIRFQTVTLGVCSMRITFNSGNRVGAYVQSRGIDHIGVRVKVLRSCQSLDSSNSQAN
jgi:hypothetical protein